MHKYFCNVLLLTFCVSEKAQKNEKKQSPININFVKYFRKGKYIYKFVIQLDLLKSIIGFASPFLLTYNKNNECIDIIDTITAIHCDVDIIYLIPTFKKIIIHYFILQKISELMYTYELQM